MSGTNASNRWNSADRDLVALGIATAAIILFVATGSTVLPRAIDAIFKGGAAPDHLLVNALLLNIVLIIFGWRRYRELQTEIGERRRAEALARELAETDPLTRCLNRRSMTSDTDSLCARAQSRGEAVAFFMIDLDNFKQINDMHGHPVGDQVLVELAERFRKVLPEGTRLARLGGDEFAFVTTYPPARRDRIDDLAIRLFEAASAPFALDGITLDVTISLGIASDHEEDGSDNKRCDSASLMQRADIAMYSAKKDGKNRCLWFEPTMENDLRFRNQLEQGLRRALAESQFEPFYEQQIDLDSGELVGFEMLARWDSPELGLVSPEIFIPIAEEMGLIVELSEQLVSKALVDASGWDPSLTLAINISPVQLRDPWFAQKLLKLLVKHNFPPQRLEIEITETCLHDNVAMVRSMIVSLRNQGVRVSLDDFGTGFSSLEQLRSLPFDRIKIDRAFVGELRDNEGGSRIVDAIVSLGRGMGLPVTAEGIEDAQMLDALRKMGKLKGQGYHYGKPENAEQVHQRLLASGLAIAAEERSEFPARKAGNSADDGAQSDKADGAPRLPRIINM
ncbi:putative bifunctional diguanylate cyclase/phosphodiesterase [Qipengyuania nanhaisediminis]|uniref:putative bifunctional diguanylate cyclase/phosphodiesterase n=1 Tax=Qipengyuania nanhaisediminis TaxID=604088 RepID=UPI0038B25B2A